LTGYDESASTGGDSNEEAITNAEKSEQPLATNCKQNSGMLHLSLTQFRVASPVTDLISHPTH
jgi:hypothetical protein